MASDKREENSVVVVSPNQTGRMATRHGNGEISNCVVAAPPSATHEGEEWEETTNDGTVDRYGKPAIRSRTGGWRSGSLVLVNQGLATLAFFGLSVNLVLFLTRVLRQDNADAANNVSKWTGTVYIFSLLGAFVSDSYLGRYKACTFFLTIFVGGLVLLASTSQSMLLKPDGCGDGDLNCQKEPTLAVGIFYLSVYMIALGNGGYQPNAATFGADQFDDEDDKERPSKVAFFSWFYLALNLGSLFSNTFLGYFEDNGMWALGFWISALSAFVSMIVFLVGTPRYRHHKPGGNPFPRFAQVFVAATFKFRKTLPQNPDKLFELPSNISAISGSRKIHHSDGFRWLDKAAIEGEGDEIAKEGNILRPWRMCTVTQVEEVKCIVRMLPIWACTITYSVIFTQMASIFVEQGAAMNNKVGTFKIPPAAMSSFDILSVAMCIILYRRVLVPLCYKLTGNPKGLTELQRMGVGLVIGMLAMVAAGTVEIYRRANAFDRSDTSSLTIMWQIPQYCLIGASEVFMYVGQLEFFNSQSPDALKSFGSALCMASMSLGNFMSTVIVTIIMDITKRENSPGWIPGNLNEGRLELFFFVLAAMAVIDLAVYVFCAKAFTPISLFARESDCEEQQPVKAVQMVQPALPLPQQRVKPSAVCR